MNKIIKFSFLASLIALSFTLPNVGGYQIGDTAEDFNLKNVDGKMVTLKDYKNAIEALKAGKNPEPSLTKAVGCSIKKKRV